MYVIKEHEDLLCKVYEKKLETAWVVPLKDKRRISVVNAFQKIISKGQKPKKVQVDSGGEFYNKLFKRFLKINSTEIFSTCNEGKSVVAERFIRTLKIKIFKHVTTVSKNVYFDVLDDIINKYNNKVHKTMKMKLIYVTSDSYADYNQDSNKKILNLKLVIMAEHKKTKKFLLWDTPKIQQKKFLSFAKLKILT